MNMQASWGDPGGWMVLVNENMWDLGGIGKKIR